MSDSLFQNYALDLCNCLKERAIEAKHRADHAAEGDKGFALGWLMAYHEVISIAQQQAAAFGIELSTLNLGDINPERDLL